MSEYVLVWDLETVPDLDAISRVHDLDPDDESGASEIVGDKFPKHLFHKIVCIGAIIAKREQQTWKIVSRGAPHIGIRSESDLISSFVDRVAELQPTLVTFNGNGFDLPVLRYRAMVHRIAAPGLMALPYFNRYSSQSVDLCDVLASYGSARATLHEVSRTLGFDGKASDIDGSDVAQLYAEGRIQKVADYCVEDVTNTYRIWLAYERFCGRLSEEQYRLSDALASERRVDRAMIRTQLEWEAVKSKYASASDYRSFKAECEFEPSARLTKTGVPIREALPRAREGGSRWRTFEAIHSGMTVEELNRLASEYGHSERDADLFIALFRDFVRLTEN